MSIIQINVSMMFGDITAIVCRIHTKYFNIFSGHIVEILNVKACGTYSYHCGLRSLTIRTVCIFPVLGGPHSSNTQNVYKIFKSILSSSFHIFG